MAPFSRGLEVLLARPWVMRGSEKRRHIEGVIPRLVERLPCIVRDSHSTTRVATTLAQGLGLVTVPPLVLPKIQMAVARHERPLPSRKDSP